MTRDDIIKAMHDRLYAIDPTARGYLFGSRARGEGRDDPDWDKRSDWDVLVLLDKSTRTTWDDFNKYAIPLEELGWDINEIINPIVRTMKDWKENGFSPFNHNVEADAIAI